MKLFLYSMLFSMVSGCCLRGSECDGTSIDLNFRILDYTSSKDLVFGSSKMYEADSIQFFSLSGSDTIRHFYRPEFNSYYGADSVLAVHLGEDLKTTIFIRLNDSDIDTLQLTYSTMDGGECCGDYAIINSVVYNNDYINISDGRLYKKNK